uniref:Uncharacterized protein n=1 Tax=Anguilla anguilla TaxID=7936 RepID=A0A0E9T3K1_ANGAN
MQSYLKMYVLKNIKIQPLSRMFDIQ